MKAFFSELFGNVQEPENFYELLELIRQNTSNAYNNVRMWRGQGNIDWPIHSGAYRRLFNSSEHLIFPVEKDMIEEKDIIYYEESLLRRARHRGFGYVDGRNLSDFELLVKLQHHGAATRLVDFSKNCLVALWFCVDSYPDKTGLLLGVHTHCIAGEVEGSLPRNGDTYSKFTKRLQGIHHPMFIEPPVVSPRISAQHGVFLYSAISNDKTGSLKLPAKENESICIPISSELKKNVRKILIETFDIRTETLFPDLDGFSISNNSNVSTEEIWRW